MGLLNGGRAAQDKATEGFDDPALAPIREASRGAQLANRKTFVARLPLPTNAGAGDVPMWSAALQQVGQHDWTLTQWSVCPEADGPVAYAVFTR